MNVFWGIVGTVTRVIADNVLRSMQAPPQMLPQPPPEMLQQPPPQMLQDPPPLMLQQPPPNGDEIWNCAQKNLKFYLNEIPARPDGAKIDEILLNWYGDYAKLKEKQFYIQWLFPNKEGGTNALASPLTEEEAQAIRSDPILKRRFLGAFKMILDLYGMALNERNEIKLKDDDPVFLEHLKSHSAAPMWITRILKALKELGYKELMLPWLHLLRKLIYDDGYLPEKFAISYNGFWFNTLDPADQESFFSSF